MKRIEQLCYMPQLVALLDPAMHEEAKKRWIDLAAEVAKEHDPARLLSLVTELNNLLLQGPPAATKPSDVKPASEPPLNPAKIRPRNPQ